MLAAGRAEEDDNGGGEPEQVDGEEGPSNNWRRRNREGLGVGG